MYLAAFENTFLPLLLKFTTRSTSLVSCGGFVLASDGMHAIPGPERRSNWGTGCSLAGSPTPNMWSQIASGKNGCRFFIGINRFVDNIRVIVSSQSPRVIQEFNNVRLCG